MNISYIALTVKGAVCPGPMSTQITQASFDIQI